MGMGSGIRSFSGADIKCVVHAVDISNNTVPIVVGNLQTLSYSIHREKFPVRELGKARPVGFTRGTRTIAGTLIFTMFDREVMWELLRNYARDMEYIDGSAAYMQNYPVLDQMPPFDITIVFQNEYGDISSMAIYGVEIVDEGMTVSVDDILTEKTCSYVALEIDVMTPYTRGWFGTENDSKSAASAYEDYLKTLSARRAAIFSGEVTPQSSPYDSAVFERSSSLGLGDSAVYNYYGEEWVFIVGSYDDSSHMYSVSPSQDHHPLSNKDHRYIVHSAAYADTDINMLHQRYYMPVDTVLTVPPFALRRYNRG